MKGFDPSVLHGIRYFFKKVDDSTAQEILDANWKTEKQVIKNSFSDKWMHELKGKVRETIKQGYGITDISEFENLISNIPNDLDFFEYCNYRNPKPKINGKIDLPSNYVKEMTRGFYIVFDIERWIIKSK